MGTSWESLLDVNMDKVIAKCFINNKGRNKNEIFVIYEDGSREVICTYDPNKLTFEHTEFIGHTKLDAVFYCDYRRNASRHHYAMY